MPARALRENLPPHHIPVSMAKTGYHMNASSSCSFVESGCVEYSDSVRDDIKSLVRFGAFPHFSELKFLKFETLPFNIRCDNTV